MENISIEALHPRILSISSQRGRCRTTRLQDYRVPQKYRLPSQNVMHCVRVSLGLRTVKIFIAQHREERRGSWVISLYLWLRLTSGSLSGLSDSVSSVNSSLSIWSRVYRLFPKKWNRYTAMASRQQWASLSRPIHSGVIDIPLNRFSAPRKQR
jgi:hypothetical protein